MQTQSPPLTLDYETKGLPIFQRHQNFFYSIEHSAKNVPVQEMIRKVFSYKGFRHIDACQSGAKGVSGFEIVRGSFRHKFYGGAYLGLFEVVDSCQRFNTRLANDHNLSPRHTTTGFSEETALGFRRYSPQARPGPQSSSHNPLKKRLYRSLCECGTVKAPPELRNIVNATGGNPYPPRCPVPGTVHLD